VASGFPEEGGGVLCDSGATIVNTIMYYNMAGDGPNLHNDSGTVSFSCATPAMGGTSNITDVPLFADAGVGGFRLSSGSPCIDTGTDRPGVDADMDGVPRPLIGSLQTQAAFDMGAYEFVHATADTDGDELGDADELVAGTDPTDGTDVFMVDSAVPTALGDVITWNTVSGRYYTVMTTTNLPDTWENVGNPAYTNVMGLGLSLSYTNSDPDVATRYFMLKVRDE
jgi:hypothetical protein